jgi:hypothetical protein
MLGPFSTNPTRPVLERLVFLVSVLDAFSLFLSWVLRMVQFMNCIGHALTTVGPLRQYQYQYEGLVTGFNES